MFVTAQNFYVNIASPIQISFSQACLSCLAFCTICFSDILLAKSGFRKSNKDHKHLFTTIPLGILQWWNGEFSCTGTGNAIYKSPYLYLHQPFFEDFDSTPKVGSIIRHQNLWQTKLSKQCSQRLHSRSRCGTMHGKYFLPFCVGINDHQKLTPQVWTRIIHMQLRPQTRWPYPWLQEGSRWCCSGTLTLSTPPYHLFHLLIKPSPPDKHVS